MGRGTIVIVGLAAAALGLIALLFIGTQISMIQTMRTGVIGPPNEANNRGEGDIPEGATPVPTPAPADAALGVPLRVDRLDIPLDHTGHYAIQVGEAVLPNGYVTWKHVSVANGDDGSYLTWEIRLELRPSADASPFPVNRYEKGLVDGPQRVVAFITFDLDSYRPGAVMRLRDIIVR